MRLNFAINPERTQCAPAGDPFNIWTIDEDRRWLEFHRRQGGFLLRFPDLADFEVSGDGLSISATPVPGVSEGTLQHLYLNQVGPLALNLQGRLAFHSSAVAIGGASVAFFGATGRGKSTLAASFARNGNPFLTEDVMTVERSEVGFLGLPSHPSIRLWQDSEVELIGPGAKEVLPVEYTSKARFLAGGGLQHCETPMPLLAAYHLGERAVTDIVIEPMPASAAVIEIIKQSFQLDIEDGAALKRHFAGVAEFCAAVPCYKLDYPRDYRALPQLRAAIIAHALELGAA